MRLEVGIGIVHLPPRHAEVEDVLDEAQRLAGAARQMRSRAAIADPASGAALPLEEAQFEPMTWRTAAGLGRQALAAHRTAP